MATHELKTGPEPFRAIADGLKTFEYRRDDRAPRFAAGDFLTLDEYIPERTALHPYGRPSGHYLTARVTCVARGPDFDIPVGYVVMSLADIVSC